MFALRDLSPLTLTGVLAVLAIGFLAFAGLVGLRFLRRGSARFWAAPAALALCLLPLAVGAAFCGLVLRSVFGAMALTGSGGVAAIAAGTWEALMPLLLGLAAVAGLAACAFLMTAAGSGRSTAAPGSGVAGWALLAVVLVALALSAGVVGLILSMAAALNGNTADPATLPSRLSLAIAGSFALVAVTLALAPTAAIVAPRGPGGFGIKLASLASIGLCGVLAVAGSWAAWSRSRELMATALTGVPQDALPEPVQGPYVADPEPSSTTVPPPLRPPAADRGEPSRPARQTYREGTESSAPRPGEGAYRVGGAIREPRKIKNVTPVYPEIAKQARVQGVVILEAAIDAQGRVASVKVLRGIPLLDQAAMDAVKQCVYEPTLLNGVPVPVIMTVTVNYRLSSP